MLGEPGKECCSILIRIFIVCLNKLHNPIPKICTVLVCKEPCREFIGSDFRHGIKNIFSHGSICAWLRVFVFCLCWSRIACRCLFFNHNSLFLCICFFGSFCDRSFLSLFCLFDILGVLSFSIFCVFCAAFYFRICFRCLCDRCRRYQKVLRYHSYSQSRYEMTLHLFQPVSTERCFSHLIPP